MSLLVYLLLTSFLQGPLITVVHGFCPIECICDWEDGEVVICKDQQLEDLPVKIDTDAIVLDFSGNALVNLTSYYFSNSGLINLEKLYLNRCSLRFIHRHAFINLDVLVVLDLSRNYLHEVPGDGLAFTISLRKLMISHNPIKRIRATDFSLRPTLEDIDASNCEINYIHPNVFTQSMPVLQSVNFSNNQLTTINRPALQALFSSIEVIDLNANPWECDCKIKPLYNFLSLHHKKYLTSLKCYRPLKLKGKAIADVSVESLVCPIKILSMKSENHLTKVKEYETAKFECEAESDPIPNLEWYLGINSNEPISNNTRINLSESELLINVETLGRKVKSVLKITNVLERNHGLELTCEASNKFGSTNKMFVLEIIKINSGAFSLEHFRSVTICLSFLTYYNSQNILNYFYI